ncbi:carboxylesterase family protein [Pedobacter frigoris]|uniref:Alpha/beta hydrolase n=1 Tax=Pedobacter frigoris TaxID=2571272 RepID=A0A4U1CNC8_9SPHI|nr:prolyl oligopeptidase family serine peptidase [Pedobacter frigoris]TKC09431.1 alpha/beta hydrolase [Pedobacter frigoris]
MAKFSSYRCFVSLIFCSIIFPASAQNKHTFTSGLLLRAGTSYGREALYTDPLAYALYTNTLRTPFEGEVFGKDKDGNDIKWTKITVDGESRFRGRGASNGYVYYEYIASEAQSAVLNITGNATVFVNGEPHMGDPYAAGWMNIPLKLKKGKNEFFVRGIGRQTVLTFPTTPVFLDINDATVPVISGAHSTETSLKAAVVVVNTTAATLHNLKMRSSLAGKEMTTALPAVPAYSTRKVYFDFEKSAREGQNDCLLSLLQENKVIDQKTLKIESVKPGDKYAKTFVSGIDGSLQYFAVAPQTGAEQKNAALFFSVHGAGVEAIGQARAYQSKDWGTLVAPTNRRPRGFNWEDWGRLDALEVLNIAKKQLEPDPQRIYLTGHSMGGHGTWFLGATYPDKWAAIAPCAGYPTLKGYGSADGLIPESSSSELGQLLLRTSNQSDVPKLAYNYKKLGVYVLHGDADETVSVKYARQMKSQLAAFHPDMSYYEYPGGSHWYGNHSVDWLPIFDFFKWHTIPLSKTVETIDFTTASPGISASNYWVSIHQQVIPLKYSNIKLNRNLDSGTISGTLENVALLKLSLSDFPKGKAINIRLDSLNTLKYTTHSAADSLFLEKQGNTWTFAKVPDMKVKGPHRYGTFKEGFNKHMLYVYGTGGTNEEQAWSVAKARFDAESWYYRGNGAIDIIADKEYSKAKYAGRNVVLIGNGTTNSAWKILLADCPVQVNKNTVTVGSKKLTGDDLGAYFIWPIAGTQSNTVSVIAGSGLKGMKAANANQYFAGGSGFPDIMVFRLKMLTDGIDQVEYAGFYDNNWNLK